jgi:DNA-binding NarL/FixJ family response regulator
MHEAFKSALSVLLVADDKGSCGLCQAGSGRRELLTARDAPEDVVKGLDAGADDYLTKPFDFEVLPARIRARTRTPLGENRAQMRFADLFVDSEKREAANAWNWPSPSSPFWSVLCARPAGW